VRKRAVIHDNYRTVCNNITQSLNNLYTLALSVRH